MVGFSYSAEYNSSRLISRLFEHLQGLMAGYSQLKKQSIYLHVADPKCKTYEMITARYLYDSTYSHLYYQMLGLQFVNDSGSYVQALMPMWPGNYMLMVGIYCLN